jgi:hypothetical protein
MFILFHNPIGGVMVSMLASSTVDHGFDPPIKTVARRKKHTHYLSFLGKSSPKINKLKHKTTLEKLYSHLTNTNDQPSETDNIRHTRHGTKTNGQPVAQTTLGIQDPGRRQTALCLMLSVSLVGHLSSSRVLYA